MTRILSIALVLAVGLGIGSELAYAGTDVSVLIEWNGLEAPATHDAEDIEETDEVVPVAVSASRSAMPDRVALTPHRARTPLETLRPRPPRA